MAGADIFILPSHREGFGSTVIEAAATGIPAIASRIYGLTDAVQDGETGYLRVFEVSPKGDGPKQIAFLAGFGEWRPDHFKRIANIDVGILHG